MCLSLKRRAAVDMALRSKAMSLTQGYSKVSRTGGAFGAPWFGAALVVLPVSHTLIRADPQWIFVLSILNLWIDYQSGAEPRRSKGSASPRLLDHYQVKDRNYDLAKSLAHSPLRGGPSPSLRGSGAFLLFGVRPGLAGSSPRYLSPFRALIASTHLYFLRIIFQPIRERRSCHSRPQILAGS